MVFHREALLRIREARERASLALAKRREFKALREKERFERDRERLRREGELELGRAEIRKAQAIARPKSTASRGSGGFAAFQSFASDFASRQQPASRQSSSPIVREKPRKAAAGRTLFDAQGRPVSVRNAPTVRRAKKRRKAAVRQAQPVQNPLAPTIRF